MSLNQPLSAIVGLHEGLAALARKRCRRTARTLLRDAMDKAADQALRAGQIIRRLREFVGARAIPSAGSKASRSSSRRPAPWRWSEPRIKASASGFNSTRPIDLVLADKVQIQQVLLNLLRNAVDVHGSLAKTRARHFHRWPATTTWSPSAWPTPDPGIAPEHDVAARSSPLSPTSATAWASACRSPAPSSRRTADRISVEPNPGGGTIFRFTLRAASAGGYQAMPPDQVHRPRDRRRRGGPSSARVPAGGRPASRCGHTKSAVGVPGRCAHGPHRLRHHRRENARAQRN